MNSDDRALAFFARGLIALLFLVAGVRKLLAYGMTVGYFTKLGLPMPDVVAAATIAVEIGGAILLVVGWRLAIVSAVLAAFTLGTALVGHRFWAESDPQAFGNQLNNFLKNIAIVGGFATLIVDARRARRSLR